MKLIVLGSNSKGNCYLLQSKSGTLIIEAGVHINEVKKSIDFRVSDLLGAVITHRHGDHAKYIRQYQSSGIKVYAPGDDIGLYHRIMDRGSYDLGEFTIKSFLVVHDVETYCFLIHHPDMGLTAYVTDTHFLPYLFNGINHYLIECNYDPEILDENVLKGRLPAVVRHRILNSHMSLDTLKGIFCASKTMAEVNNIVLLHLSDGNSDSKKFKSDIEALTGKNVFVANKGLEIDLTKTPF